MSDLAVGMGYSIYFMLAAVAIVIGGIVLMIVKGEKNRRPVP